MSEQVIQAIVDRVKKMSPKSTLEDLAREAIEAFADNASCVDMDELHARWEA